MTADRLPGRVFFYGSLLDAELRSIVLDCKASTAPAELDGFVRREAGDGDWPTLMKADGESVPGGLSETLAADALARLDWYESIFGYSAASALIGGTEARLYLREEVGVEADWSLEEWRAKWAPLSRVAAAEAMEYHPARSPEWVASRWRMIRTRADSAIRAERAPAPTEVRSDYGPEAIEVLATRRPYTDFFSLIEQDLRFRRFQGGTSDVVTRAALIGGDAATLLPYDPKSDRVLLVEQFRFGPWARGDRRPWTIEPIAGRVDPGEAPETTVVREAREEAGVEISRLERVGGYYASTGAFSEYVISFVGICDLSRFEPGVSGAESEDEDILSHVIPFERLMQLVETGEAEDAPLLITAWWLVAHRDRLRGE